MSISQKQMLQLIKNRVKEFGSQAEYARSIGIPPQRISNALMGLKLPPKQVLDDLEFDHVKTIKYRYEKKTAK